MAEPIASTTSAEHGDRALIQKPFLKEPVSCVYVDLFQKINPKGERETGYYATKPSGYWVREEKAPPADDPDKAIKLIQDFRTQFVRKAERGTNVSGHLEDETDPKTGKIVLGRRHRFLDETDPDKKRAAVVMFIGACVNEACVQYIRAKELEKLSPQRERGLGEINNEIGGLQGELQQLQETQPRSTNIKTLTEELHEVGRQKELLTQQIEEEKKQIMDCYVEATKLILEARRYQQERYLGLRGEKKDSADVLGEVLGELIKIINPRFAKEKMFNDRYLKVAKAMYDIDRVAERMVAVVEENPALAVLDVEGRLLKERIKDFALAQQGRLETLRLYFPDFDDLVAVSEDNRAKTGKALRPEQSLDFPTARIFDDLRAGVQLISEIGNERLPLLSKVDAFITIENLHRSACDLIQGIVRANPAYQEKPLEEEFLEHPGLSFLRDRVKNITELAKNAVKEGEREGGKVKPFRLEMLDNEFKALASWEKEGTLFPKEFSQAAHVVLGKAISAYMIAVKGILEEARTCFNIGREEFRPRLSCHENMKTIVTKFQGRMKKLSEQLAQTIDGRGQGFTARIKEERGGAGVKGL